MKRTILQSANNYQLFCRNKEQRPLNSRHVARIRESMRRHGFRPSKPIQCYQLHGKLVVVDGHHRLEAAKELGIAVYYVVEDESAQLSMLDENVTVLKWSTRDTVEQWAKRGKRDYQRLLDYVDSGIPLVEAASLLAGQSAGSHNVVPKLSDGSFVIKTTAHADAIVSIINLSATNKTLCHRQFIQALSLCLWVSVFDVQLFKDRAARNLHMIPRCSNVDDFLTSIEDVYNFRSKHRVPIAFFAKEAAKARSAVLSKAK